MTIASTNLFLHLSGANPSRACSLAALFLAMSIGNAEAGSPPQPMPFVAGLQPDRRPAVPQVTDVTRGEKWYARAFTGVEQPYPWSLRFINEQGNWHTPFVQPGMTGPYDIRGWHRSREVSAVQGSSRK